MKVKTFVSLSCFVFSLLLPSALRADIIHLKNGNTMEAKILKEDKKFVTVQTPGGKVKIPKNDIQMIERKPVEDFLTAQGK
ncbi:MAG: hypothetical protein V1673_03635 [Candidatus Omnitrophota bacterium]